MAVTPRLRFEIFRRDNFTCQYCGRKPPEVELAIDHVTPKSLGGNDDPSNLRTACRDCNTGKASMAPDQAFVDASAAGERLWQQARQLARAEAIAKEAAAAATEDPVVDAFEKAWGTRYKPYDWAVSLAAMARRGLSVADTERCVEIALTKQGITSSRFRYFCGVAWNVVRDVEERAAEIHHENQRATELHYDPDDPLEVFVAWWNQLIKEYSREGDGYVFPSEAEWQVPFMVEDEELPIAVIPDALRLAFEDDTDGLETYRNFVSYCHDREPVHRRIEHASMDWAQIFDNAPEPPDFNQVLTQLFEAGAYTDELSPGLWEFHRLGATNEEAWQKAVADAWRDIKSRNEDE